MLSVGIQFGKGFDSSTIVKVMQSIPVGFDFDLLVVGCSPGGIACAREAASAGKKAGIVRWNKYSPAELEGYDEDMKELGYTLEVNDDENQSPSKQTSEANSFPVSQSSNARRKSSLKKPNSASYKAHGDRKVRLSRMDMNNEFYRRGPQCRKLMRNAVLLASVAENAQKSGWRIPAVRLPLTINWTKMSEEVMDYVMQENWLLATALSEENIQIIDAFPDFTNQHTAKLKLANGQDKEITFDVLCFALTAECVLPDDVIGAEEHGITCDDFIRMEKAPGKTLIVGCTLEGLECAGIIGGCKFPVTLISRTQIFKNFDSEISNLIMNDLKEKGVVFKEFTTLVSITKLKENELLARFTQPFEDSPDEVVETEEQFETVLFAIGRQTNPNELKISELNIELEPETQKIRADENDSTSVPNIYAVGDGVAFRPAGFDITELTGKLLGRRLFHEKTELMNYSMIPTVLYTPTEYAYIGVSEEAAIYRLGAQCVEVYHSYFKPLDFVIPAKTEKCFVKIIVCKKYNTIMGLHIFGPQAGEIIQGFAAAARSNFTMATLQTIVGVTGTIAQEILKVKEIKKISDEDLTVPVDGVGF